MPPVALTIAGSDPSGGAGLQADLKTFHQFGVYGMSAVTMLTVQSTRGVEQVRSLDPDCIAAQIDAAAGDIPPDAAKTGALGEPGVIEMVAARASRFGFPLVVDPVLISKHGDALASPEAVDALRRSLLPHAHLTTPNLHEAAALLGVERIPPERVEEAARDLLALGPAAAVLTGGDSAVDILATAGGVERLEGAPIETTSTHGSGCAFSAACCALLARGEDVATAARLAKRWIQLAVAGAPGLGAGRGPLDLHAPTPSRSGFVRIDAITLAVGDMARSVAFYEALGLRVDYGGPDAPFTTLKDARVSVNLMRRERGDDAPFWGRAILHVEDVDAMHARATAAGLAPAEAPHDAPWGERCFHITDPDGHEISLAAPLDPARR